MKTKIAIRLLYVSFVLVFIFFGNSIFAQDSDLKLMPKNGIHINLLGDISLVSVNYERLFFIGSSSFLSGKLGIGFNEEVHFCLFSACPPTPHEYITYPFHITGNFGYGRHFFEVGIGATIMDGNITNSYLIYPIFGYRFLPLNSNRVYFRAYAQVPINGLDTEGIVFVPIGVSLGVSF